MELQFTKPVGHARYTLVVLTVLAATATAVSTPRTAAAAPTQPFHVTADTTKKKFELN